MKNRFFGIIAALALICAPTVSIASELRASPVDVSGDEMNVRYLKGVPTLNIERKDGSIHVTPLPIDHGHLAFGIAVFNAADKASNFGIESIAAVSDDGAAIHVFSRDDMVKQEKNRAMWASIAVAVVTAGAAAAASNVGNHSYSATTFTPRGRVYRTVVNYHNSAESAVATGAAIGAGGYAINEINKNLDDTILNLNDEIVQTTTIDPGTSYGGRFVIDKVKVTDKPRKITLNVTWNGETYPFTFKIEKQ